MEEAFPANGNKRKGNNASKFIQEHVSWMAKMHNPKNVTERIGRLLSRFKISYKLTQQIRNLLGSDKDTQDVCSEARATGFLNHVTALLFELPNGVQELGSPNVSAAADLAKLMNQQ